MTVKKEYNIGDTVWIYGVGSAKKLTKGTVVKDFTIDYQGISEDTQYVIAIPTEIDYLLEIRSWQTISQDHKGPIGAFRSINNNLDSTHKLVSRSGYVYENSTVDEEHEDPSAEQILAALEMSIDNSVHRPLVIKETKAKSRQTRHRFPKKKSKE